MEAGYFEQTDTIQISIQISQHISGLKMNALTYVNISTILKGQKIRSPDNKNTPL